MRGCTGKDMGLADWAYLLMAQRLRDDKGLAQGHTAVLPCVRPDPGLLGSLLLTVPFNTSVSPQGVFLLPP